MFNVLLDRFFPVVTRAGLRRWLSFAELADDGSDPPVGFDWPRADFNTAACELAIGVATMAFRPARESDWVRLWRATPDPNDLRDRLAPFVYAFELVDGETRFLQELGGLDGDPNPIEALLIDTPGTNGQKKNADLLTHRGRYPALGFPAAAMALYTLQQFAPSGGAGNRTSMRGGGPMTTIIAPGGEVGNRPSLWRVLLANLLASDDSDFDLQDLPKILPWLRPTLTSDDASGARVVHQTDPDAHPLQWFFGMPRRIKLEVDGRGSCPMTELEGPLIRGFVQKPWGVNYGIWTHPLTPYRRQKEAGEPYSVKPKSSRFGYRDWVSVVVATEERSGGVIANPAAAVNAARRGRWLQLRGAGGSDAALRAAGWAMNNMEAVAYLLAEQPLHLAASPETQIRLDETAVAFARAADEVASLLIVALRRALFNEGAKPAADRTIFEGARAAFYEATEDAFHGALDTLLAAEAPVDDSAPRAWLDATTKAAEATFADVAPVPIDDPERAARTVSAYNQFRAASRGFGTDGRKLFAILGLAPPPEAASTPKKGAARGR
jgi:CRISPR system Cascade subunit CasA